MNEFIRIHVFARVALPMKRTKSHSRDILSFFSKRIHAEPARPSKVLIIDMLNILVTQPTSSTPVTSVNECSFIAYS